MSAYSFLDGTCSIIGPGGCFDMAAGAGAADEGIKITPVGDKNVMTTGAGGDGMHSLIASTASGVSVNLLKTSPINAKLQAMYNLQSQSSMYWGKNTITYRNAISGDLHIMQECAFKKAPEMAYAKEGGIVTWDFDAIKTASVLGTGTPEA